MRIAVEPLGGVDDAHLVQQVDGTLAHGGAVVGGTACAALEESGLDLAGEACTAHREEFAGPCGCPNENGVAVPLAPDNIGEACVDAIWANTERLADPAYQDTTTRFVAASLEGWAYCRDNVESCRDIVVAAGSTLGASHQLWQVNEVNKLIWPAPAGAGTIDEAAWARTVQVARTAVNADGQTVITADPDADAYTNTYVEQALELLRADGVDVEGTSFAPVEVTLNPGGS